MRAGLKPLAWLVALLLPGIGCAALPLRAQAPTPAAAEAPAPHKKQVLPPMAEGIAGSPLDAGLDTIAEHFIVPIPREQLEGKALAALLEALDPYSHYLEPAEMDAFRSELDASFAGVGINFSYDDPSGYPRVAYLLRGGAAAAADVRRGDLLLSIDGKDLKGQGWEKLSSMLRGHAGTPLTLRLRREGVAEPLSLTLTRVQIDTPSVRALQRDAADRPDWWLEPRPAHRLPAPGQHRRRHLDGRGGRGARTATRQCARAGAGPARLRRRPDAGRAGDRRPVRRPRTPAHHPPARRGPQLRRQARQVHRLPLAILINGGTVSSCEILAGALADNGRGTLVGERSYGKGRIQVIYSLGEGRGGIVMSTGTFQRPNGQTIDKHDLPEGSTDAGIAPQVEVKMDAGAAPSLAEFRRAQHRAAAAHAGRRAAGAAGSGAGKSPRAAGKIGSEPWFRFARSSNLNQGSDPIFQSASNSASSRTMKLHSGRRCRAHSALAACSASIASLNSSREAARSSSLCSSSITSPGVPAGLASAIARGSSDQCSSRCGGSASMPARRSIRSARSRQPRRFTRTQGKVLTAAASSSSSTSASGRK
jgi:carboxyl-terminal processing protease